MVKINKFSSINQPNCNLKRQNWTQKLKKKKRNPDVIDKEWNFAREHLNIGILKQKHKSWNMPEFLQPSLFISSFTTASGSFKLRPMKSLSISENPMKNWKLKILFLWKQKGRSNPLFLSHNSNNNKQRDREGKKTKGKGSNCIRKRQVQLGSVSHEFREILTVKSYFITIKRDKYLF